MAIDSMRDNGFLSAAHALAELIDNSIQAGATSVELIAFEQARKTQKGKTVKEIEKIGVLDNGCGMGPETLHMALEFGASKNREDAKGIGKFGMGLPNSSISQAQRVDVWSWTDLDSIHHTYLDIEEIKRGELETIPIPERTKIPKDILSVFKDSFPEHGTLVLWSKIDRCRWKTGKSIHQHTDKIVGRMYRSFLNEGKVNIRYKSAEKKGSLYIISKEELFLPNDPLYIMKDTSLPALPKEFKGEAMFELVDDCKYEFGIPDEHGNEQKVRITGTALKKPILQAIRQTTNKSAGNTPWGKHALSNLGLSVVRSGREIALLPEFYKEIGKDRGWARFYSIQIDFDPSLDTIFGVTNNKQHAVNLIPSRVIDDAEAAGYDSEQDYRSELLANGDLKLQIYEIINHVRLVESKLIKIMQGYNFSGGLSDDKSSGEKENTTPTNVKKINEKEEEREDIVPTADTTITKGEVEEVLEGIGADGAKEKAKTIVEDGLKVWIEEVPIATSAFFDVSTKKGLTLLQINANHVFTTEILNNVPEDKREAIEICLAGWARMERECTSEKRLMQLQMARKDWGQLLEDYLEKSSNNLQE